MREKIELQLSEFDENNMSDIKRNMLIDDLKGLDEINQGEVRIDSIFSFPKDGGLEVGCFIRNATASHVSFGNTCIRLIHKESGKEIIKSNFSLNEKFKGIGSNKGRYLELFFPLKSEVDFNVEEGVLIEWSEELESGKVEDTKFPFLDALGDEKNVVEEFIQELTPLIKEEVGVDCFSLERSVDGSIDMLILVRNSCEKAISLKKIDIQIIQGEKLVAGGEFETEFIRVQAGEGKLFRFPIKKEHIYIDDINFEQCEVIFK